MEMDNDTTNKPSSQGRPLPDIVRHQAIKLHLQGRCQRDIADVLLVAKTTVGNIVNKYYETGKAQKPISQKNRGRERQKLNNDTMTAIELYKLEKPSIYSKGNSTKISWG